MTASTDDLPTLYHGTCRGFTRGGYLFPVSFHGQEARPGHNGEDSINYAYATSAREMAVWYALQTPGRGRPKVLTVAPIGDVESDPSTYSGERGHQYRSMAGFKVVAVEFVEHAL